jgi:DNA replication protein DnaC
VGQNPSALLGKISIAEPPLTAEQRRDLLEIVDDRYEKGSLLITSQIPIGRWHEVIADSTLS